MNSIDLMKDLKEGYAYDVVGMISARDLDYELAELLYTWSVFESDPVKLQGALRRHIKTMCERIASHQKSCSEREAEWLDSCDRYYDQKKDSEAERG